MEGFFKANIAQQLRKEVKKESGRIVSVTAQGDKVYAIVRLDDKQGRDESGNQVVIRGGLVGNIANLPEDELTLAEILIDTDIDLSATYSEISQYIGRRVKVEFINGAPIRVVTRVDEPNPRSIPRQDLWTARNISPDRTLKSKEAQDYLRGLGYEKEHVESVTGETFGAVKPEGYELTHADAASWNRAVPPKASTAKDISSNIKPELVSGLPATKLGRGRCYRPARALTAR